MVKYSIIEKFNILLTIIKSSPFFLTCFIVGTFLLSFVILDYKTTKKVRNKFLLLSLILTIGFIIYKYYNYLISLSDNLVEEIFMAIYFPNLAVYTIVIVSTNICLFTSLIKKKTQNEYKVANVFSTILLDFLFILILETIIKNKIDVYETLTVYSNKELLVLIELSTAIYTAWLIVVGFMKLVDKTVKKEVVESKKVLPVYEAPTYNAYEMNNSVKTPVYDTNDYTSVFTIQPNRDIKVEAKVEEIQPLYKEDLVQKIEPIKVNSITENVIAVEESIPSMNEVEINSHSYNEEPVIENVIAVTTITNEKEIVTNDKKGFMNLFDKTAKEETLVTRVEEIQPLYKEDLVQKIEPIKVNSINENVIEVASINEVETNSLSYNEKTVTETIKENDKKKFIKLFDKSTKEEETTSYRVPLFETLNDDAIMNCIVPIHKEKVVPIVQKPIVTMEIDGRKLLEKFNRGEKLDVEQYKILKDYIIKQGI